MISWAAWSWLPWLLGGVALHALLWVWLEVRGRRTRVPAIRYSSLARLQQLRPSWAVRLRPAVRALRVGTLVLLALAIARPQVGRSETVVRTEGIDIVLALDASGSMMALDLDADRPIRERRHRLAIAKEVVESFVARRPNDRIGLVVFGEQAFTQCPLTLDHGVLATFLDRIDIGIAGDATAIGSALGISVKRLEDSKAASRVVVLLTDGRNNAGVVAPIRAAELAKARGVKVYTVAVGTRGKAPFIVESMLGPQVVYQDVEIDEETLATMAELTGGRAFRAEDRQGLEEIYAQIDELERTEIEETKYMEYDERFALLVWPALALLLLEVLLLATRFRRVP